MNVDNANALLASLAQRNTVGSFHLAGVNMWPLFRLAVLYRVIEGTTRQQSSARPQSGNMVTRPLPHLSRSQKSADIERSEVDLHDLGRMERIQSAITFNLPEQDMDLLHVQSYKDFTNTRDSFAEDPLARGLEVLKDDFAIAHLSNIGSGSLASRRENLAYIQPIDSLSAWSDRDVSRFLVKAGSLSSQINSRAKQTLVRPTDLLPWAMRVIAQIPAWRSVFERLRPRSIMLQNYMSLEKFSICAAARQVGIPIIDHQHGMFTKSAQIYLSWHDIPEAIIDPTPDWFWVWSDWFAQKMPDQKGGIRSITGGDLRSVGDVGAKTVARASLKTILYLHQPVSQTNAGSTILPDDISEIIRNSDNQYRWLVRLHPRFRNRVGDAEKRFEDCHNVEISNPTHASLGSCIDVSDAVVTGSSASAFDAVDAGVPVFFTDDVILKRLGSFPDSDLMHCAPLKSLLDWVAQSERHPARSIFLVRDVALAKDALRHVLAETSG